MDGISIAIQKIDAVFHTVKKKFNSCSAAISDLKKAFDILAFPAIFSALTKLKIPIQFINYIRFLYCHAQTHLHFRGHISKPVTPRRGVRQGDPLSSTLFLIVLDFVLRALPDRLGAARGESLRTSHLFYADDILLLARDAAWMQQLLLLLSQFLLCTGLETNTDKTAAFTWLSNKKAKKVL